MLIFRISWYLFSRLHVQVLNFFMVIGITFIDHKCHFSWLQVYYLMVTCCHKMFTAQVKRGNNTICTSIISWCSFHDVKSINVNFQIFMVCYFEVTCRRIQFSMVANTIFVDNHLTHFVVVLYFFTHYHTKIYFLEPKGLYLNWKKHLHPLCFF